MKRIVKKIAVLLLITVLIIPQAACGANGGGQGAANDGKEIRGPVTGQDFHFDTVCQITIYSMDHLTQTAADDALEQAFALCGTYEDMLSKTLEGTDIYKINHAGGKPVECDPETVEIIRMGLRYAEMSDGKFDITIGKAVDLWDFHADAVPAVPDPAVLSEAVSHVDYKAVRIDGGSELTIYTRIALPLSKPIIATVALMSFIGSWNNYLWPLLCVFSEDMYTLPVGIPTLLSIERPDYVIPMTANLVASLPMIILYLIFEKQIVQGITMEGIKG